MKALYCIFGSGKAVIELQGRLTSKRVLRPNLIFAMRTYLMIAVALISISFKSNCLARIKDLLT